jgi:hypothetical protein
VAARPQDVALERLASETPAREGLPPARANDSWVEQCIARNSLLSTPKRRFVLFFTMSAARIDPCRLSGGSNGLGCSDRGQATGRRCRSVGTIRLGLWRRPASLRAVNADDFSTSAVECVAPRRRNRCNGNCADYNK